MTQYEMFPTATSSQQDIPANRSASQVSAKERKMIGTSGRTSAELLHKKDPLGAFSKMFMATSQWGSTKCCLTWKPKATPQGRLLFQLAVSMPRTNEIASGSSPEMWPTPIASTGGPSKNAKNPKGKYAGNPLATAVAMWPTPRASAGMNDTMKSAKSQVDNKGYKAKLEQAVALWPAPTANEDAAGTPEEWKRGTLNPNWVEWLMGYPIGHTVLKD